MYLTRKIFFGPFFPFSPPKKDQKGHLGVNIEGVVSLPRIFMSSNRCLWTVAPNVLKRSEGVCATSASLTAISCPVGLCSLLATLLLLECRHDKTPAGEAFAELACNGEAFPELAKNKSFDTLLDESSSRTPN